MTTFSKLCYLLLILLPLNTLADNMPKEFSSQLLCSGLYADGEMAHVLYDPLSSTLNLNTNLHKIVSASVDNNGYNTEKFTNAKGLSIYFSLIETKDNKIELLIYDANTNKLRSGIELACHKTDSTL